MTPFYYAEESRRNYDAGQPTFTVYVKLAVEGQVHLKNPTVYTTQGRREIDDARDDAIEWGKELKLDIVMPEDLASVARLPKHEVEK